MGPIRLMRTQGLSETCNRDAVGIQDIVQGDIRFAMVHNFMIDPDWLLGACPKLLAIPCVQVFADLKIGNPEAASLGNLPNFRVHMPPVPIPYGTHHTKMFILVYESSIRVCIHTANLIHTDWNHKTQGAWFQDFPRKQVSGPDHQSASSSAFEDDLVEYMSCLGWAGAQWEHGGQKHRFKSADLRQFDFSKAQVRLVGSVPGYHRGAPAMHKWGHLKLRRLLQNETFKAEFSGSPVVCQFSSLGALTPKWLAEFNASLCAGCTPDGTPLAPGPSQLIWPTVEDVRCDLMGYAAGGSIPGNEKNILDPKKADMLDHLWHKWNGAFSGRQHVMPHMKSYTRYATSPSSSSPTSLAYFVLTSHNLSTSAWGQLQKNETQLFIRSYELGVVFLPSTLANSVSESDQSANMGAQSASVGAQSSNMGAQSANVDIQMSTWDWNSRRQTGDGAVVVPFKVPYALPPQPYSDRAGDEPWVWDVQHKLADRFGRCGLKR